MNEFIDHLHEVFADFGPTTARNMFGGHGIYHQGLMFALVADGCLYLKTDHENVRYFTERGLKPFEYSRNGATTQMSYYLAPEEMFEDPALAALWARRSYGAALRAQKKKGRCR